MSLQKTMQGTVKAVIQNTPAVQPDCTADAIVKAVTPSRGCFTSDCGKLEAQNRAVVQGTAETGNVPDYDNNCAQINAGVSSGSGVNAGEQIGLSVGADAMTMIPVVGPILGGLFGGLIGLFTHHSQMVKAEQNLLCPATLQVQRILAAVDQAVSTGQLTTEQAVPILEQMSATYSANVSSMVKPGNGVELFQNVVKAAVLKRKCDYAQMAASSVLASSGVFAPVSSAIDTLAAAETKALENLGLANVNTNAKTVFYVTIALVLGIWYYRSHRRRRE